MKPGDMPIKIQDYCRKTGQVVPESKGAIVRCAMESLAMKYRDEFTNLEKVSGHTIDKLHILGGGTQNELLNQFTANAIRRKVITGPIEATAVGNILAQLIALGEIEDVKAARNVVRNSFELKEYNPENEVVWDQAYSKYRNAIGR